MIKNVRLDRQGLELFIGSLEATIMRGLWDQDTPVTMVVFYRYLISRHLTDCSYSSIITTLNRLADKQLIIREQRENNTPLWSSKFETEDIFVQMCINDTLMLLHTNYANELQEAIICVQSL